MIYFLNQPFLCNCLRHICLSNPYLQRTSSVNPLILILLLEVNRTFTLLSSDLKRVLPIFLLPLILISARYKIKKLFLSLCVCVYVCICVCHCVCVCVTLCVCTLSTIIECDSIPLKLCMKASFFSNSDNNPLKNITINEIKQSNTTCPV